jgi:hypothetical protein
MALKYIVLGYFWVVEFKSVEKKKFNHHKFGQSLQDARSLSQTEEAVEREQISSDEQVLPTPDIAYIYPSIFHRKKKIFV